MNYVRVTNGWIDSRHVILSYLAPMITQFSMPILEEKRLSYSF